MSDTDYTLWCYLKGDTCPFPVVAPPTISVGVLKNMIKEELGDVQARNLILKKVRYF
jgi:hypothetical protein